MDDDFEYPLIPDGTLTCRSKEVWDKLTADRDALLKAAKEAEELLKDLNPRRRERRADYYRFEEVSNNLRAAIAAAEGQPREEGR